MADYYFKSELGFELDENVLNDVYNSIACTELSDETQDVALKYTPTEFIPNSPRGPPERNDWPGVLNFRVEVTSADANKKKFLYSHKLGRIYVDINCNFSVLFNWDCAVQSSTDMYVRATVVFAEVEQSEKRVESCVQHFHESSKLPKEIAKNVLRSTRELGTQGVYYCGAVDVPDSWYSVLVHFSKSTAEPCAHAYQFTCKSSCATGINRRAIAIIFTLEDHTGEVYGRQKVGVKVCSCLRRDMHKDEETEEMYKKGKKRIPSNQVQQTKTKKIKLEPRGTLPKMVKLPDILVEENALKLGLRSMIEMMSTAGHHNPEVVEHYAHSIAQLNQALHNLENTQQQHQ